MKRVLLVTLLGLGLVYGCGSSASTPPPPAISVTVSPSAAQAIDQGQTLSIAATVANDSSGKGVTWTVTGGGTLSATTGSPVTYAAPATVTSNTSVKVTATSVADTTKSASVNIVVSPPPVITTTTLPADTEFTAYSQTVTATGGAGTLAFSISLGALPAGLTLNSSTGAIMGTPTGPNVQSNFSVKVTDSSNAGPDTVALALSITINLPPAPVISTTAPPAGTNGTAYTPFTFTVTSGGHASFTWSETGTLPSNMTLSTGGVLSGTPGQAGSFPISVSVQDSSNPRQSASQAFTLQINNPPPPSITTTSSPNGIVGNLYNQTIQASGGLAPFTWSVSAGTLPAGLGLSSSTTNSVTLTGTPTTAQSNVQFTIQVTDSLGRSSSQAYTVSITIATLSFTTRALPNGVLSTAYDQSVSVTGGVPPYQFSLASGSGPLPTGLNPLGSNGAITGTPTAAGTFDFTVQVADSETPAATATQAFSIVITPVAASCFGTPTGNESMLNGEYAFVVQGFQGSGNGTPVAIAASFSADGAGNVTGGDFDINEAAGATHATISASSYTVGLDSTGSGNLGCLALSLSNGSTTAFRFSLGGLNGSNVFSKGRIVEYDDVTGTGTRDSGVLLLQDASSFGLSHLQPRYAFGVDGVNSSGGHFASAGSFTVDTSGNISSGFQDANDAGSVTGEETGGTGKINAISTTTGRATMSLTVGGQTTHQAIYMVNADEFFMLGTDPLSSVPIQSGRAIATASSFSQSSLSGNYVIHTTGIVGGCTNSGSSPCAHVSIGLVNLTSGDFSGTVYDYDITINPLVLTTVIPSGATYAVDATSGRVTLAGAGGAPVVYLATPTATTEPISAFLASMTNSSGGPDSRAAFGFAEVQPNETYSTSALAGNYFGGTEDPGDNTVRDEIDVFTLGSGGAIGPYNYYDSGPDGLTNLSPGYIENCMPIGSSVDRVVYQIGSNGVEPGTGCVYAIFNGTRLFIIQGCYSWLPPAVVYVEEHQ